MPIEEIVEFTLGLDIVPVPGLHENYDIDGYLSRTLDAIWVDEFFFLKRPARYRFTLAHEVAHLLLHRHVYGRAMFDTIGEWKEFTRSIPEVVYGRFEHQAYRLGGLILMPLHHLRTETDRCVRTVAQEGVDLYEHWDFAWERIASHLAERFEVSHQAVEKALEREKVRETYERR